MCVTDFDERSQVIYQHTKPRLTAGFFLSEAANADDRLWPKDVMVKCGIRIADDGCFRGKRTWA